MHSGPPTLLGLVSRGVVVPGFELHREITSLQRLIKRYANVPMSLADACLVRMAEVHEGATVLTMDSHFEIYRKNGRQVIPVLKP